MTKKKASTRDALSELLQIASKEVMTELVSNLAAHNPEVRRECFEFLKSRVSVSESLLEKSLGEIVMALWWELEPDLEELDDYGGGDYGLLDDVCDLLHQITQKLKTRNVDTDSREELLEEVLPYIESANSGLEDMLDDLACAACYNDEDLRYLAQQFEKMGRSWRISRARDIYRALGDRDKYLELRLLKMEFGMDYHDLAAYYWEAGEKEKAIRTCEEGLRKGTGRMVELQQFAAERAMESGDRKKFLAIQFDTATRRTTLETYEKFEKVCTKEEWTEYEEKVLNKLKSADKSDRLDIHMHRKEYDKAITLLAKMKYPAGWDIGSSVNAANKLKTIYPEQVLAFFLSGLGNLNTNYPRKIYAEKASVMVEVRLMLVDVIKDQARWEKFASKVKRDNIRRPAFQEEFARKVPGWNKLGS